MKKITVITVIVLSVFFFILATQKKQTEETDRDVLTIATGRDATRTGDYSPYGMWEPAALIYETLVNLDAACNPVPCLAESWTVSEDGKSYVFYLRKGVSFHDGTPFDAAAVRANVEKLKSGNWSNVVRVLQSVNVIDAHTVELVLKRPHPTLFTLLASSTNAIVAPASIKAGPSTGPSPAMKMPRPKAGSENSPAMAMMKKSVATDKSASPGYVVAWPVGTGPYIWDGERHLKNRCFSVVRNDVYWQGTPRFSRIDWQVVPDAAARAIALESGKVDLTGETPNSTLSAENIKLLKNNEKIKVTMADNWGTRLMIVNHTRPPFDDPQIRSALKYAIDVKAIQKLLGDTVTICPGPLGPTSPLTDPSLKLYDYDVQKARAILDAKNIIDTNGDGIREYGGRELHLSILSGKVPTVSVLMREFFRDIGIDLTIDQKETGSTFQILAQMQFDIATHSNIPSFYLNLSQQFSNKGGRWSLHIDDPALEDAIQKYNQSTDWNTYKACSFEIQRRVHAKQIILFAVNEQKVAAYRKDLGEFVFPPEEWVGADQNLWNMKKI
ncbi:ABC transporter substrate-binding protein [Desulfosarcina ovata]|uniref:ABC transporter substrate-binding protein n=1 Tax=Desulfosarcina ovata subsp. ovata TaxID=2752305 RepID=A0A5K8AAW4_9BACT|nr:ABC transporter substrate-binding protein [Desulfosarcina ovata]BBO89659.1 ABC transporter substrate-binding protein [Desulfosarcina ovata subsp. ovata]